MDKLYECAAAYQKLLDVSYKIILGRKGKLTELHICFEPVYFHHLIGLHKLRDLRISRANRAEVFENILNHRLTYDFISKSTYFHMIRKRFDPFTKFETILDQNNLIFRYNNKLNQFSLIDADYLLSTPHEGTEIYVFIAEVKNTRTYFCRSFFPKEQMDYTKSQTLYTLLYKEKTYLSTGETIVQYDRLTPKAIG